MDPQPQEQADPVQILLDLSGAYAVPRCLHVIADIAVADVLSETPRTAEDLATDLCKDHPHSMRPRPDVRAAGVLGYPGSATPHAAHRSRGIGAGVTRRSLRLPDDKRGRSCDL